MKKSVLILGLVLSSVLANANELRKVSDGTASYCPTPTNGVLFIGSTFFKAQIDGNDLVVRAVACQNDKWSSDQDLSARVQVFNTVTVTERFSQVQLVVQAVDQKFFPIQNQYQIFDLTDFPNRPTVRIPLSDLKKVGAVLDLNLRALKTIEASNGYSAELDFQWGSFRLHLD